MKLIAAALGLGCLWLILTVPMSPVAGLLCLIGVVLAIILAHAA